jgi:S-adenosylmethionine synthetase
MSGHRAKQTHPTAFQTRELLSVDPSAAYAVAYVAENLRIRRECFAMDEVDRKVSLTNAGSFIIRVDIGA